MRHLHLFFLRTAAAAIVLSAAACINNDIPYPTIELGVQSVQGEGFALGGIDAASRTATIILEEQTDIRNVRIDRVELSCTPHNTNLSTEELLSQTRTSRPTSGIFDLRTPLEFTLSLYQDYHWRIVAEQTIEYRFTVAGQVGSTLFDLDNRIATAFVAKDADRSQVTITALKLGPADKDGEVFTTYSESIEELSALDFSAPEGSDPTAGTPHFVEVTAHGRTEHWTLFVLPTDRSVTLDGADAWSRVVWLYGSGIEGQKLGFRYRQSDDQEWQEVPDVEVTGGTFRARFTATEETAYQFIAYCGEEQTDPVSVTTDPIAQLPNSDFEQWCTLNNIVYPYAEDANPFWGTGNVGASLARETLTDKSADPRPGSAGAYSAVLQSKFVMGVKLAAGNLFTGRYVRSATTDGILTFGRPFTLRPTALRLWVKYTRGKITQIKNMPAGITLSIGDPDNGYIYVALGTWSPQKYGKDSEGNQVGTEDSPHCVDTRSPNTFVKTDGKDVVGLGQLILGDTDDWKDITEWQEIIIPIEYKVTDIRPTHIMIVCSASRWGDYFTGSKDSRMQLDDFELLYE